jgi:hypothetical protein
MFEKSVEDRLSAWADHRAELDNSENPLDTTWEFWRQSPYIPYNHNIEPFNPRSWPTPWDIIVENKYDDFTKSLMIAWTLKYTNRFKNSKIEIKTLVNDRKDCYYNVVCVDDEWAINYNDNGPVKVQDIPDSFFLENLIEVEMPR